MMMAQEMPSTPLLLPVLVILLFCSYRFYAKFTCQLFAWLLCLIAA